MTKHSKNNTASSIFSYAEYKKLDYGTKKQRLGNDSMKPFDSCVLCLQQARDPVACSSGHLYCRECVYKDLLAQRTEIKRQKARLEAMRKEEEAERERARIRARERVIHEFERSQVSLAKGRPPHEKSRDSNTGNRESETTNGVKRKFDFDTEKLDDMVREAESLALEQIQKEQAEAKKAKLPDFWLPSLTPEAKASVLDYSDIKLQTLCNASTPSHPLSIKTLIPVKFTFDPSSNTQNPTKICPSCKKELTTNSITFLMRPCAHVVCKSCQETLVAPANQCAVCDEKLTTKECVQLSREGTGFAGGGRAETSKIGVAFQG